MKYQMGKNRFYLQNQATIVGVNFESIFCPSLNLQLSAKLGRWVGQGTAPCVWLELERSIVKTANAKPGPDKPGNSQDPIGLRLFAATVLVPNNSRSAFF